MLAWALVRADDEAPARKKQELPPDLQRISADAGGFVSVRVADLWDSDLVKPSREKMGDELTRAEQQFRAGFGVSLSDIDRVTLVLVTPLPDAREEPLTVVVTRKPYDRDKILGALGKAEEQTVEEQTLYVGDGQALQLIDKRTFAVGPVNTMRRFLQAPPRREGPLGEALRRAADKHAVVAGLNCTRLSRLLDEELGGDARHYRELLRPLFRSESVLFVSDVGEQVRISAEASFARESDARVAVKAAGGMQLVLLGMLDPALREMQQQKDLAVVSKQLRQLQAALREAPIEQHGSSINLSAQVRVDPELASILTEIPQRVRRQAMMAQSQNNLKQIAIAMHNYNDTYGKLPTQALYGKDGKPLLSWRVAILPFIEQQNLYQQFHLDEPWDSEHNKKLLETMPKTYASPADPKGTAEHRTHYLGFHGPGAFFEGKQANRIPASFPDGTSNTIMIVEASDSVPWTKPADISFDPDKELPKIGGLAPGGFLAALCDGSTRLVSKKVSKQTLKWAIIANDGQVLGPDW
jgi:hypothetical protein